MQERRHVYVRFATGELELSDLRRDPFELQNRADALGRSTVGRPLRAELRAPCDPAPAGSAG